MESSTNITITVTVNANIEKVWQYWTAPEHITQWCQASPEWHAPKATNDLRVDGKFSTTMAARDGSMSFDFEGVYQKVERHQLIEYTIVDGRKVSISFKANGNTTEVVESFEAEQTNPVEMQRGGWQAILDNFKTYTENH